MADIVKIKKIADTSGVEHEIDAASLEGASWSDITSTASATTVAAGGAATAQVT